MIKIAGFKSKKDIIGKTDAQLWPAQATELRQNDTRVMDLNRAVRLEENVTLPSGNTRYFMAQKMPLRDFEGNMMGIIGTSLEICP